MKKNILLVITIFLALFPVSPSYSLIPPTPDDELVEESEIIVVGKGVTLISVTKDEKWKRSTYHSWVLVPGQSHQIILYINRLRVAYILRARERARARKNPFTFASMCTFTSTELVDI